MAQSSKKIKGEVVAEIDGLTISIDRQPAKTSRGKSRVWVQIRQNGEDKPWRVAASLSYARSADIEFVKD